MIQDNSDYSSLEYHFACKPSTNFADNAETVSPDSSSTTDNGVILPSEPEKMINLRDKASRLNGSGGNRGDTASETQSPQSTVTYIPGEGVIITVQVLNICMGPSMGWECY